MHLHTTDEPSSAEDAHTQAYPDRGTVAFMAHSSASRVNTDIYMTRALRYAHPSLAITTVPQTGFGGVSTDLLAYAAATGKASASPIPDPAGPLGDPISWRMYVPPARRLDDSSDGRVAELLKYGKYAYKHDGNAYILYVVDGRDGTGPYPQTVNQYLVHAPGAAEQAAIDKLVTEVGRYSSVLHDEIWVFDQGRWVKDAALYASVQKSRWSNVILDEGEKKALQADVRRFFDGRQRYEKLGVPWKRGVIYHGPPGNGKTISIKAIMHELYARGQHQRGGESDGTVQETTTSASIDDAAVPTLYVRSLASYGGPEYAVKQIFSKARVSAPCLLVFEDLDSIVTDAVRSYFLNEVDGLAPNDGIYMIGSTNHLDRLDPGLAKRPSRFDRKFYFPKPDLGQRTTYAEYWRAKLEKGGDDDDAVEFPKELCLEMAKITDDFSFAYMQEAFVAALLGIASKDDDGEKTQGGGRNFEDLVLWKEFKKAVKVLRDEM